MLEKNVVVDRIEVLKNQIVAVYNLTSILENGLLLAEQNNVSYIRPGDDYSKEDDRVKAICAVVHTPEIVAQYQEQFATSQSTT